MDLKAAITAHSAWKSKLTAYINHPDHSLDANAVSSEDSCDLGRWLHGAGQRYSALPEFSKLVDDHRRFHKAAGDVIRKANAGLNMSKEVELGGRSEFSSASSEVVSALMKMIHTV